jgi:hypothetical protein
MKRKTDEFKILREFIGIQNISEATALFPALRHHGIADFGEDSPTLLNALIDANDDTLNQAINQLSKKFKGKDTEIGFIGRPDITAKVKGFAIKKGKFRDGFSSYNYSADLIIKTDKGDIGVITKGVSHMAPPVKLEDSINESRIIIGDLQNLQTSYMDSAFGGDDRAAELAKKKFKVESEDDLSVSQLRQMDKIINKDAASVLRGIKKDIAGQYIDVTSDQFDDFAGKVSDVKLMFDYDEMMGITIYCEVKVDGKWKAFDAVADKIEFS